MVSQGEGREGAKTKENLRPLFLEPLKIPSSERQRVYTHASCRLLSAHDARCFPYILSTVKEGRERGSTVDQHKARESEIQVQILPLV